MFSTRSRASGGRAPVSARRWYGWMPISGSMWSRRSASRSRPGELLDVDPALGGDHREVGARRAVEQDRRVELGRDRQALLDQDAVDLATPEPLAEHALGRGLGLVGRVREHHPAALAAAADLDLHLHDRGPAQDLGRGASGLRGLGDDEARHRDLDDA